MRSYEKFDESRIERLYKSLAKHGIADEVINEIMMDGETINKYDKPEKKPNG